MGLSDLYGEPWHIERYHRKEGDEKRHRSKCCYYNKKQSVVPIIYLNVMEHHIATIIK